MQAENILQPDVERANERFEAMRSHPALEQDDGRDDLTEDFVPRRDFFHVVPESHDDDKQRAEDDVQLDGQMCRADLIQRDMHLAHRHARHPTHENRYSAQIGHGRRVQFPHLVRLVDDPVIIGNEPHDRRENETDNERRIKNVDVRGQDDVPGRRLRHGRRQLRGA